LITLIITILIIIAIFFAQRLDPFIAGLMAVVPIKIIATALFTSKHGGEEHLVIAIKGMLIGQFVWGFILLITYIYIINNLLGGK